METLSDTHKEVGLEINVDKTKYMLLSRHQNVGKNQDIKIHLCLSYILVPSLPLKTINVIHNSPSFCS
jgi:hypothetical protein